MGHHSSASHADTHEKHGHGHDEHHDFAHPAPVWQLLTIFFILVLLTFATVYQSNFALGSMEVWVSLFIATIKASLVILFFMHMIHDKPFNIIMFIGSLIFVSLFLGFTLMDAHNYEPLVEEDSLKPPAAAAP